MIRVAVVARSEILRAGIASLIRDEPDLEIAGGADSEADVIVAAAGDLDFEELDETGAPAVVLIADALEPGFVADALRAGIKAVLPAAAAPAELAAAIRAAAAGLTAVRPADLDGILAPAPRGEGAFGVHLSPRELEILQMLAEGLANKQIAWKLGISEHTVKFHVAAILNRLNAGSRAQAVAIGIRRGLILI